MTLIIHIICSILSLALHSAWLANALHQKPVSAWLRNSTFGTLGAAVVSGLLLNDGTLHSLVHSSSMLGVFLLLHTSIYATRRVVAKQRS